MAGLQGKRKESERAAESGPPPGVAAADYLAGMLPGLVRVADGAGLELVAYLLQMASDAAAEEAVQVGKRTSRSKPR